MRVGWVAFDLLVVIGLARLVPCPSPRLATLLALTVSADAPSRRPSSHAVEAAAPALLARRSRVVAVAYLSPAFAAAVL